MFHCNAQDLKTSICGHTHGKKKSCSPLHINACQIARSTHEMIWRRLGWHTAHAQWLRHARLPARCFSRKDNWAKNNQGSFCWKNMHTQGVGDIWVCTWIHIMLWFVRTHESMITYKHLQIWARVHVRDAMPSSVLRTTKVRASLCTPCNAILFTALACRRYLYGNVLPSTWINKDFKYSRPPSFHAKSFAPCWRKKTMLWQWCSKNLGKQDSTPTIGSYNSIMIWRPPLRTRKKQSVHATQGRSEIGDVGVSVLSQRGSTTVVANAGDFAILS